jgi:aspartate aminotransferase/aminotransferase
MVAFSDLHSALYKHLVNLFGGTPVYLDTYDTGFGIDAARLEKLITKKTKLLLLNSPGNPTGRIFPKSELEAIAKVCAKHGITVISDEIYRAFSYVPTISMAEIYPDTVVLVGPSKPFGMTGWRLGYACGQAEIIQAMTKVQQYSFVCAPSVVQYAALA